MPQRTVDGGRADPTRATERREADGCCADWRIKAAGRRRRCPTRSAAATSRRSSLAKWLATTPRVLLLDEPTKGVDVGAKFEIHEIDPAAGARGLAVLVVSSDLPEVLALADRILVMREGAIQGELAGAARPRKR